MSASLVGSEMCIRDRLCSNTYIQQPMVRDIKDGWFCAPQPHADPGGAPVSYTHLTLPTICSV
eukprot:10411701-Alexandrium_andersonii.AAC.1